MHVNGAICQQRGLLTLDGKEIKNKQEILDLLQALHLPQRVSVIHCPGHQKDKSPVACGNNGVDQAAKGAAQQCMVSLKCSDCHSQTAPIF